MRCSKEYVSALSFERTIASGFDTSTGIGKRSTCSASPSRSNDDCGRIASTRSRSATASIASGNSGAEPAGTGWNASQRWRPTERSLMSVPTSRTSRSPFSRSARRSAAVPGAPDAVTMTVIGFTRGT
jgi:hypothetical protein